MVTVVQLRGERRRSFRAVRTSLNKVRKAMNLLHRELSRRLEGHYTELLDVADAQRVVDKSQAMDTLWQEFKTSVLRNLEAFFR